MRVPVLINGIVGLLTVFVLTGVALTVKAMLNAHRETRAAGLHPRNRSLKQRARDYVGPIDRSEAPLNPPFRVLAEFFFSLGGFPGMGWLLSGRIIAGLILMCLGPALVWGLVPVALSMTGLLLLSPYSVVIYLPLVAIVSSGALAIAEIRTPRPAEAEAA